MSTLVIDCEFNSYKGQLLSMALVEISTESHPKEFYRELELPDEPIHEWVNDNVLSLMDRNNVSTVENFHGELEVFLCQFESVHILADWPEDLMYFCEALITGPGERINTPPLTMEVRRDLDADSKIPHHALWDARGIAELYETLIEEE